MAAFRAAIAQGFGIECDVRASRDGVAFVFHDPDLARLTGAEGALADQPSTALDALRLPDGGVLPRLDALLTLCGGDTPLLVEIKVDGRNVAPICAAVARDLARHRDAPVAVMSFNPVAMRWFATQGPGTPRGLVITRQGKRRWRGWIERGLALWTARPDFIACDVRDLPSAFSRRTRNRDLPVLSWTVRSAEERARAAQHADQIIFEGRP